MATADATSQKLNDGILTLLKPAVEKVDAQVHNVRESQFELRKQIEAVTDELKKIGEEHHVDINLEPYIQRLINTKRRVVLVSNIVQNIQERLAKLHKSAEKEAARHKAHTEARRALLEVNIETPSTSNTTLQSEITDHAEEEEGGPSTSS